MKKNSKNGFTLIELLAVIIILGILMIIAIPSVTSYITNSRKDAYIDTAKQLVAGARNLVNKGDLEMYDVSTTYYIPIECIDTENGQKSPYGDFSEAYVVVTYDGKKYNYYWTSRDETGQGVRKLTRVDDLDIDDIESDIEVDEIRPNMALGTTSSITIINQDLTKGTPITEGIKHMTESGETAFKISFNNQDGNGCSEQEGEYLESWGNLCTPTKYGYSFDGWYTEPNGGGTQVTSSTQVTGNATVYAKWIIGTFKLTYNNQGGNGCSEVTKEYLQTWGGLCTPNRTGYTFQGWYTEPNGGGSQITSSTQVTGNVTAYARWVDLCANVTYQNGTTCSVTYQQQTGTLNRIAYSSVDPTYACPAKNQSSGGSSCNGTQDACTNVVYQDGTTCSVTYQQQTGTLNRLAFSSVDNSIACTDKNQSSGGSSCNGTEDACATTTDRPSCGGYGGCSTNGNRKARTCTHRYYSTVITDLLCSTGSSYTDYAGCSWVWRNHWGDDNGCLTYCQSYFCGNNAWTCRGSANWNSNVSGDNKEHCWCLQ